MITKDKNLKNKMSTEDKILAEIDDKLEIYFDSVGFQKGKTGKKLKELWCHKIDLLFSKITHTKLSVQQETKKTELYKEFRHASRSN